MNEWMNLAPEKVGYSNFGVPCLFILNSKWIPDDHIKQNMFDVIEYRK